MPLCRHLGYEATDFSNSKSSSPDMIIEETLLDNFYDGSHGRHLGYLNGPISGILNHASC